MQNRLEKPSPAKPDPDAERAAFICVNEILRDDFALSVFQIHAVHEAIRQAGMDLQLRQK